MAKFISVFFFVILSVSLLSADFKDIRNLTLDAKGIDKLEIDCGAGYLEVYGEDGLNTIEVEAEIFVDDLSGKKAKSFLEKHMRLELDSRGSKARLNSYFEDNRSFLSTLFNRYDARINLIVHMPANMILDIEDGSGYIRVRDINEEVSIDDGSGDVELTDIGGRVEIDDGSGEIELTAINGTVRIDDGSGDLEARDINGNLYIDDGSGDMRIQNILGDVEIDDGSGELVIREIDGNVIVDDGSGDIYIEYVKQDVEIINSGSGSLDIANVEGKVRR